MSGDAEPAPLANRPALGCSTWAAALPYRWAAKHYGSHSGTPTMPSRLSPSTIGLMPRIEGGVTMEARGATTDLWRGWSTRVVLLSALIAVAIVAGACNGGSSGESAVGSPAPGEEPEGEAADTFTVR